MCYDLVYIKELSIAIISSFIGFVGAWCIFKATNKKEHHKSIDDEKKLSDQKLAFFYFVLRKIWSIGQRHAKNFEEYAKTTKESPVLHQPVKTTAIYELTRFTTSNWEDQFTYYIARVKGDKRVMDIFEIMSTSEFICFLINDALRIQRVKMEYLNAKKVEFKQYFLEILDLFNKPDLQTAFSPEKLRVGIKGINEYKSWVRGDNDVEVAQQKVIIPLLFSFQAGGSFQDNLDHYNIRSKVFKCNSIYNEIIAHAENTSEIFNEFSNSLKKECDKFPAKARNLIDYLKSHGYPDAELPEIKEVKNES